MGEFSDQMKKMNGREKAVIKQKQTYHTVQCSAHGCPLGKLVSYDTDYVRCQFHEYSDDSNVQAITRRIHENKRWLDGYRSMVRWGKDEWSRFTPSLQSNEFLPMRAHESPSMYLNRYMSHLHNVIEGKIIVDKDK